MEIMHRWIAMEQGLEAMERNHSALALRVGTLGEQAATRHDERHAETTMKVNVLANRVLELETQLVARVM